jgi:uracil-DNA glycosylase family 4
VPATLLQGPVLWLGEAPGATEVQSQQGFTGKSGQLLRREAKAAGVSGPWSFTNAVHCRPEDNRTPHAKEVQACLSQFVLDEVRDYSYVVMAGNAPLQAFFPGAKSTHFRGNFALHPDFPGQRFYNIYHPAYILRRPDLADQFKRQLERLGRAVRGERKQAWTTLRGAEGLAELRMMVQASIMSTDLETNQGDSWKVGAKVKSFCSTADGEMVVAFSEEDPQWEAACGLVDGFLADPNKGIIGSNVSFDVEWREREGGFRAEACGIHDVGIIWYEAEQYKQPSLKQLVAEQLDGYTNLVQMPHEEKDTGVLLDYNAEDVVHSYHLFVKGMTKLKPKTRDLVTRVIGPMTLVYQRAKAHGMYIREDYRQQLARELEEERHAAVLAWKEEDPEFVPGEYESGKGLHKYLFQVRKLPVLSRTASEKPSTDKAYVKQWIRGGATYLNHLLKIREVDKMLGTFVLPLAKSMDEHRRIHPKHWLTSTDTSRPSSSNPNVYNVPRDRRVRNLYGCSPGHLLLESDLSQIEFRIMVCLANDENGIAGYMRGDDAHTMTARTINGTQNPTKEQRTDAKPVNFGNLYGAHWRTAQALAANDHGVIWSDAKALAFQDAFFGTYQQIRPFHEHSKQKLVRNRGWFESVTGHVFYYRDWDHRDQSVRDHAFRSALNAEAQGPGANICYYIAVLVQRLFDARKMHVPMVNSVYDSVMLELPNPNMLEDAIEVLNEATALAHEWVKDWFVVPLVLEHAVGESWGELDDYRKVTTRILGR